jgi:hypothetical protein
MRRITCHVTGSWLLLAGVALAQSADRFRLETFTVDVATSNRSGVSVAPEQTTFLLDSGRGRVWRCTTNGLATITFRPDDTPLQHAALKKRLQALIVPECNFRRSSLSDVAVFLQQQALEYDDPAPPHPVAPIRVSLAPVLTNVAPLVAAEEQADPFAAGISRSDAGGISFVCRFVSLWDILKIITELTNLRFRLQGDHEVVIESTWKVRGNEAAMVVPLAPGEQFGERGVSAFIAALNYGVHEAAVGAGMVTATGTPQQRDLLEAALVGAGLVRRKSGPFALSSYVAGGRQMVRMTGPVAQRVWRYQAANGETGVRVERFVEEHGDRDSGAGSLAGGATGSTDVGETFQVFSGLTGDPSGKRTAQFKLDTQLGRVWRLDGDRSVPVHVGGQGPDWQNLEQVTKPMRRLLEEIMIPEVVFREAWMSDAVTFFADVWVSGTPTAQEKMGVLWGGRSTDQIRLAKVPMTFGNTIWGLGLIPVDAYDAALAFQTKPITYEAKNVSLWKALKETTELAGCEVAVRDGVVFVGPPGWEPGTVVARVYRVLPSQTMPLGEKTAVDDLARLGFVTSRDGRLHYFAELHAVVLADVPLKHDAFVDFLRAKGFVPTGEGPWRLVNAPSAGHGALFLLNSITGDVWIYRVQSAKDGAVAGEFIRIQPDTEEECIPP